MMEPTPQEKSPGKIEVVRIGQEFPLYRPARTVKFTPTDTKYHRPCLSTQINLTEPGIIPSIPIRISTIDTPTRIKNLSINPFKQNGGGSTEMNGLDLENKIKKFQEVYQSKLAIQEEGDDELFRTLVLSTDEPIWKYCQNLVEAKKVLGVLKDLSLQLILPDGITIEGLSDLEDNHLIFNAFHQVRQLNQSAQKNTDEGLAKISSADLPFSVPADINQLLQINAKFILPGQSS